MVVIFREVTSDAGFQSYTFSSAIQESIIMTDLSLINNGDMMVLKELGTDQLRRKQVLSNENNRRGKKLSKG